MVSSIVKVCNPNGLHLKPAGYLCNLALQYKCKITLCVGNKQVNAKSVLGVLSSCLKCGDEVEIQCDGPDEEQALEKIVEEFATGLGELEEI